MKKIIYFVMLCVIATATFVSCTNNDTYVSENEKTSVTEVPESTNTIPATEENTNEVTYTEAVITTSKNFQEASTEVTENTTSVENATESKDADPLVGEWEVRDAQEMPFNIFCFDDNGVVREGIELATIMTINSNNEFLINNELKGVIEVDDKNILIKDGNDIVASFERTDKNANDSSIDGIYKWKEYSDISLENIPIDDTVEIEIKNENFYMYWIVGVYESNGNILTITTESNNVTSFECIQNSDDIAMTTDGKVMHLRRN